MKPVRSGDSAGIKNDSAQLPQLDSPYFEFLAVAGVKTRNGSGGLHAGFDATSAVVGPDIKRVS